MLLGSRGQDLPNACPCRAATPGRSPLAKGAPSLFHPPQAASGTPIKRTKTGKTEQNRLANANGSSQAKKKNTHTHTQTRFSQSTNRTHTDHKNQTATAGENTPPPPPPRARARRQDTVHEHWQPGDATGMPAGGTPMIFAAACALREASDCSALSMLILELPSSRLRSLGFPTCGTRVTVAAAGFGSRQGAVRCGNTRYNTVSGAMRREQG